MAANKGIVETAMSSDNHTTLVAADLVGTLQGEGPFTVTATALYSSNGVTDVVDAVLMP